MAKRSLAALIALIMACFCAVSCKNETTKEQANAAGDKSALFDTVVLKIDGEPVTYEKYRYYFYGIASTLSDEGDAPGEGAATEDIRAAVLRELQTEEAIRTLAKRYGIDVGDEEWANIDAYLSQMDYYYQTSMGSSFEEVLAANYGTLDICREVYAFGFYISDEVYKYLYDRENGVIDFSDDAVRAEMEDIYCTLHILLTKDNYDSYEEAAKVAQALTDLLKAIQSATAPLSAESSDGQFGAAFTTVREAYGKAKEQNAYIGSFSPYIDFLEVLEKELNGKDGKAAAAYLKDAAGRLTSDETPVTYLKKFAEGLSDGGIEKSKALEKDYAEAMTLYEEAISDAIDAYGQTSDADFPTGDAMNALYAMRLVGAVINGKVKEYALETLQNAFAEAVRIFGEDREDPRHGVYFKKGETDEEFEQIFFAMKNGEIAGPVQTSYGVHVVLRQDNDYDYFREKVYEGYAVSALIEALIGAQNVTFEDIYETITMDTLE